jgi:hypothetical protein
MLRRSKSRQIWLMTDIPALRQPREMPRVRTSDDLYQRWGALMGPLGFGQPRLWIAFLEPSGMMSAQLTQIEDISRWADLGYAVRCWRCADTSSAATA